MARGIDVSPAADGRCEGPGCGTMMYGTSIGNPAVFRNDIRLRLLNRLMAAQAAAELAFHFGSVPFDVYRGLFEFVDGVSTPSLTGALRAAPCGVRLAA